MNNQQVIQSKKIQVNSAGGFLVDFNQHKILLLKALHHNGKMELPKGKVEPAESPEQTAIRETREETGYQNLELKDFLGFSKFTFKDRHGQHNYNVVEKTVYYFLIFLKDKKHNKFSNRESHERFVNTWVDLSEAKKMLSYPNDKKLFEKVLQILKKYEKQ